MSRRFALLVALALRIPIAEGQVPAGAPDMSLGSAHSCAVDSRGAAWCWGDNSSGQLGDGVVGAQLKLDVLNLSGGVAALGAGYQHTCALTTAGGVKCWGSNTFGELGDGTTATHVAPADVVGLASGVTAISIGSEYGCALTTSGAVRCWGSNNGNLGTGDFNDSSVPVAVVGLASGASAIAAGEGHACAIVSGTVECWGVNANGQVGDATTTTRTTPVPVASLSTEVVAIAAGARHSCAIAASGGVKCWGLNGEGQLGDGTLTDRAAPVDVVGLQSGVRALALSIHASCALMSAGGIKCWGGNDYAEQGNGYGPANLTPRDVGNLPSGFVSIAAGFNHFCALDTSSAMWCWGYNRLGQLGNGTTHDSEPPRQVTGISGAVTGMGLGALHTCAIVAPGAAKCWGANLFGQLGNVTSRRYNIVGPVSGLSSGATGIATTDSSTCAITTGGAAKCWGSNRYGELGDGTGVDHALPGDVTGLSSGTRALAAGAIYACALSVAGAVRCWGADAVTNLQPRQVAGLESGVSTITAGSQHGCAVVGGGVRCWGNNERGQLGNGQAVTTNTPVDVSGLSTGVVALAAGTLHTCALRVDGAVLCWGANDYGQLGNGNTTSSLVPVDVVGLRGVTAISASVDTTCALTTSGGFWCWGQISAERKGVPWPVPALSSSVLSIAAGNTHACAEVNGGGVRCFGNNASGQLGDGTSVLERASPGTVIAADGAGFLDLTPEDPLIPSLLSPFVALTSGVGTSVTAQLRIPNPSTPTTNLYVFALAPTSVVQGSSSSGKDTSPACVLAQLNGSGQLQSATAASLQAFITNVATAQAQAVTVLNGVPAANVAGSTFYLGYGSTGSQMLSLGATLSVASVPGGGACKPQPPQKGWWWNTNEGGRGYSIEVAGNHLFFASYLYDVSGRATWHVASGNTSLDGSLFVGKLESYSQGQTLAGTYHAPAPVVYAGDVVLAFSNASHGTMVWPGGTVAIERFNIVPDGLTLPPQQNQPEAGWWWNPSESGRGYFLEWQGGELFMAGYMYDDAGNPIWYLSSNTTPSTNLQSYANTWWQYANGQTLTGPYKVPQQVNNNVGPVTIQFQGVENAIMTLPGGATTAIRRFRF